MSVETKIISLPSKVLKWLNEEYKMLEDNDQKKVNDLLEDTGCERLYLRNESRFIFLF